MLKPYRKKKGDLNDEKNTDYASNALPHDDIVHHRGTVL